MIAVVLDRILLGALLLIPIAAMGRSDLITRDAGSFSWSNLALMGGAALLIVFIYHWVLETFLHTTPGKAILGLYVRNEGDRNNMAAIAIRNGLRIVDALALYLVGFLVALFSSRKQRLGDHIAATTVMERKLGWPARLALIALWISLVTASLWFVNLSCPTCTSVPQAFGSNTRTAAAR